MECIFLSFLIPKSISYVLTTVSSNITNRKLTLLKPSIGNSSIPCLDSPTSPVFDVAFLAFDSYSSDVLMLEKKLWH